MAANVSPREKMTLRTKIKPPKPFAGEVLDDVSSSILGDRTFDSSEREETLSVGSLVAPTPTQSVSLRDSSAEKVPPKSSLGKKVPAVETPTGSHKPRLKGEASRSTTTEPALPPKKWEPGRGMTPANNTKYLGPQIEYNGNLPPAAFPTLDTEELAKARQRGQAPYNIAKRPTQRLHSGNAQTFHVSSARTSYGHASGQQDARDISLSQRSQGEIRNQSGNDSLLRSFTQTTDDDNRMTTEIWDELSIYWRLEVVDSIASALNPLNAYQILYKLRLTPYQIKKMERVLLDRRHRNEAEDRAQEELDNETTQYLMKRNIPVSQENFRTILDNTIYRSVNQNNHLVTKPSDSQNAKILLTRVGLMSEFLFDAIPPFVPHQQKIERVNKSQFKAQKDFQPSKVLVSGLDEHKFPALKLQEGGSAPKLDVQRATAPRTVPTLNHSHRTPPPAHGTARTWKTNVPAPVYSYSPPMQGSQMSSTIGKPVKRQLVGDVIPLSQDEREHRDRTVSAAVNSHPDLQAGTALTGGGGMKGIHPSDIPIVPEPVGDLSYEDWRLEMDRRYQMGEKLINRDGKALFGSFSWLGGQIEGHEEDENL